ncbi:MAG: hypothetical protein K8H88_06555 [Sandaracinaceae bacterium]|nr:hypothetical protein [Sandaracinaceae bacterium]
MDAWVEIIREDGTLERQRIEGEKVTVGRSPAAGIPIPDARTLEPEHLLIAPRAEGCWVAIAQGAQVQAKVRGQPFEHGMLAWGTELELGSVKLRVTDSLPKEKKADGQKTSPLSLVALVIALPVLGWLLLGGPEEDIDATPSAPPPELFDERIECPTQGGGTARNRADRDAEAAIAKSERYPFAAQDGVQAVRLYRQAQACYTALGATEEAQVMAREATLMQRRMEEDYRTHRLRLELSLSQERFPDALLETRALIEILRHKNHPYVTWLRQLERQLQLRIEAT